MFDSHYLLKRIDLYLSWLESFADTEEVLGPSPSKSTINGFVVKLAITSLLQGDISESYSDESTKYRLLVQRLGY